MGMDQYLLIPLLVGWTSILTQLFWCDLMWTEGVLLVLTHCHMDSYGSVWVDMDPHGFLLSIKTMWIIDWYGDDEVQVKTATILWGHDGQQETE